MVAKLIVINQLMVAKLIVINQLMVATEQGIEKINFIIASYLKQKEDSSTDYWLLSSQYSIELDMKACSSIAALLL